MLPWKHRVAGRRETDSTEVVGIEIGELACVEFRDQDYLPVACTLRGHNVAKLGCSPVHPMHCNDNGSVANPRRWTRVENTDYPACPCPTVGVNKEAGSFAQAWLTHLPTSHAASVTGHTERGQAPP